MPCFIPASSPGSNGIAEASVKTFKRDYARIKPLPDAATALQQISGWIEEYNRVHPHSAMRMRSPVGVQARHANLVRLSGEP